LGNASLADACLLLCHNPDYVETLTDRRVGLVLSGHMHGGQIVVPGFGPRIPSMYGLKYLEGLVRAPITQVFVSRGLGTVVAPLRFRCRPEINLLTLASQQ
jgi:predicted MPP superfamily phosphohydrolase